MKLKIALLYFLVLGIINAPFYFWDVDPYLAMLCCWVLSISIAEITTFLVGNEGRAHLTTRLFIILVFNLIVIVRSLLSEKVYDKGTGLQLFLFQWIAQSLIAMGAFYLANFAAKKRNHDE